MLAICALDKPVVFKAPKTSSKAESVSQGAKPGAKTRHKKLEPLVPKLTILKGEKIPARPWTQTQAGLQYMDTEMHKEDQQVTGGPTSFGVTSEERANPQLSSGMSLLNLNKPIFSASFIIHSESASGHDASADFTAKADPKLCTPNDYIPPQQGMDEGTKNTSYDHISTCTDPHVLVDQTKSVSEGLETVPIQPTTNYGASFTSIHGDKEEASSIIKLEDLAKLVSQIQPSFKDLDSPEDDPVIIVDKSDEDEPNAETEDTSVPRSLSFGSSQIKELTNQVLILQSQKHKLELEKNKAKAKATLLKARPSIPNSLQWELPKEFISIPAKVESAQAKLKTLDALPSLLLNVTKALNKFAEVLESTFTKAGDQSVPSARQADTMPAESTTPPTTTPINPPIIATTTQMQTPLKSPSRSSYQPEGEHIKKDKGKKEKKLKKFYFVTEYRRHIYLSKEQINNQKKLEEEAKAEAAKQEGE
nr:hypothetical protein [Tanacetum cinerariifolium]